MTYFWRDYEDDFIRNGFRSGFNAREIADKLPGRTRLSVIGRLNRLGLKHYTHKEKALRRLTVENIDVQPYVVAKPQVKNVGIRIEELRESTCRRVIAHLRYCGQPTYRKSCCLSCYQECYKPVGRERVKSK